MRLDKKAKLPGKAPDYSEDLAGLSKQSSASFRIPTNKDMKKPNKSLDRHEARTYLLGVRHSKTWVGEEVIFMTE